MKRGGSGAERVYPGRVGVVVAHERPLVVDEVQSEVHFTAGLFA
jgi:hypothetical protein